MSRFIDYTDRKVGLSKILRHLGRKHSRSYWEAVCRCNQTFVCNTATIRCAKKTFACPDCTIKNKTTRIRPGKIVGCFTVVGRVQVMIKKNLWKCECKCGTIKYKTSRELRLRSSDRCVCKSKKIGIKSFKCAGEGPVGRRASNLNGKNL